VAIPCVKKQDDSLEEKVLFHFSGRFVIVISCNSLMMRCGNRNENNVNSSQSIISRACYFPFNLLIHTKLTYMQRCCVAIPFSIQSEAA
jgi:hypothetical protein